MAKTNWRQTFKSKETNSLLKNAAVSIYLAGTSYSARVFDANDDLHDTAPQLYTDSAGFMDLYIDPDDYSTGQLFDVVCQPSARCDTTDEVRLPSLQILQDTEGNRNYKNVFAQAAIPTVGMREADLWFDTDNDNEAYRYDGDNWISVRDGSIATAASTANWSQIVDDDTHKPENDADVTSAHGQSVAWLDEAVGSSLPVANTDAKCTDANADQTSTHSQGVSWLNEAVGSSLPVANTDAKCTDANADQTSTHTANNTTYVNGSETQSGQTFTVKGDLHMAVGCDISFYSGDSTLTGGLYADSYSVLGSTQYIMRLTSTDILELYATDKIVARQHIYPYTTGSYDLGSTSYRFNNFYGQGINCTYFTSSGDVRGLTFYSDGTVGCDFSGAITNLTVKKGIVTAAS